MNIEATRENIPNTWNEIYYKTGRRGAWGRAILSDALSLIDDLCKDRRARLEAAQTWRDAVLVLLNGAQTRSIDRFGCDTLNDWLRFSEGGCALIWSSDIVEHYFCASSVKTWKRGRSDLIKFCGRYRDPLYVQARALYAAASLIKRAAIW